jgi:hypothetical protein
MGVPIDSVLSAANWAAEYNFFRFYNRELSAVSVSEDVLTPPTNSHTAVKQTFFTSFFSLLFHFFKRHFLPCVFPSSNFFVSFVKHFKVLKRGDGSSIGHS